MITKYFKKIQSKFKYIYRIFFSYPTFEYNKNQIKEYWQKRRSNYKKIKPNDFQIERAILFNKFIEDQNSLLFDIGSGDGAQLIAIKEICSDLKIIGSDKDPFSCSLLKKNKFLYYHLTSDEKVFSLIEKYEPKYVSVFEVLEHMYSPEEFILKILKNKSIKIIFASVPNSGFLTHRLRFLLGRFPLQWIASPNEHIRFWTIKDLKWWLKYLNIYKNSKIIPYKGVPLLNKFAPNIFAKGSFIIIKNNL